jgi:hypothetical protein
MKKTVLTFGLISGAVFMAVELGTLPFIYKIGFDKGMIIGYTSMIAAFLMVFFGIRSYRDGIGNGSISFARAFVVGLLITIISCTFYAGTWQFIYFKITPDFFEKYGNYIAEKARASGASQQKIDAEMQQLKQMEKIMSNPIFNFLITFIVEPFPIGLLVTLVSAAILRKKGPGDQTEESGEAQLARGSAA